MSGTQYRPPPISLRDLLGQGFDSQAPSPAPVAPVQPPMTDPTRQRLLDILFQSQQMEPPPEAVPDRITDRLFPALADALTTYASAIGSNPGLRTDFIGQHRGRVADSKQRRESYQRRQAEIGGQSARGKAAYELERLDRTEAGAEAARLKESDRAYQAGVRAEEANREEQRFQTERADRAAREAADEGFRQAQFAWQKRVDDSLMKSRLDDAEEVKAGDKKDFQEELAILEETVNGTGKGDSLKELLEKGSISPEQAESIVTRRLRFSTLPTPLRRKYAEAISEIIGPILIEAKANTELAGGSPQQETAVQRADRLRTESEKRSATTRGFESRQARSPRIRDF